MSRSLIIRATAIAALRKGHTIAEVARRFGVNERTIHRWKNSDIKMLVRFPQRRRGRPRLIPVEAEKAIMNWVKQRNDNWQSCAAEDIIAHAHLRHNLRLTKPYVSKMMKRNGYSSRRTQKRPAQRADPNYNQIVQEYREENSIIGYSSTVFVMDETGLWNDSVVARSYAPRSGAGPSVKTDPSSSRDTAVATLCADGTKLPLWYLRHRRQRTRMHVVVQTAIKGMNEELMLKYIDEVCSQMPRGSILYMDNLSSHKTPRVRARLVDYGILVRYFPAKAACDLSACDNFFFRLMKNNFRKLDRSTPEKKELAANQAYNSVTAMSVRACWRKCGLIVEQGEMPTPPMYTSEDEEEEEVYESESASESEESDSE